MPIEATEVQMIPSSVSFSSTSPELLARMLEYYCLRVKCFCRDKIKKNNCTNEKSSVFGVAFCLNYCQGWGFDANLPCGLHLGLILVDSMWFHS